MDETERLTLASTFALDAAGYDSGRPDYPDGAWEVILAHLALDAESSVVEIGPGTGQATRRLVETGASVVAVEPGAGLAALLAARFEDHRVEVMVDTFENARLDGRIFDAAVAATSFHWLDPDRGIARLSGILAPGSPLALWWNVYRDPSRSEPDPIDEIVRSSTELPNVRGLNGILHELELPRRLEQAGFVDVRTQTIHWTGRHDEASLVALFESFSDMRTRDTGERDAVMNALRAHVRSAGGSVSRHYTTPMILARAPGQDHRQV